VDTVLHPTVELVSELLLVPEHAMIEDNGC
jgi:hypothetical protein